jgi:ubiquinone/menaquinone biosynthesis C-methylase UbiE
VRPQRSDYESISQYYDRVRTFDPRYTQGWLDHMMAHGHLAERERVLDVGCGTGRYTALIQGRIGRPVVGLDMAAGMLEGAKRKAQSTGADLRLVRGSAEVLPFRTGSFDAATLLLVCHHIEDLASMTRELFRVLGPGGRVLLQTRDHDEIEASYIAMFPGVLEIDLARFPPVAELEGYLRAAGFEGVGHAREENPGFTLTIPDIMGKVDERFISTLSLMSDEEFSEGREVFHQRLVERYGKGPVPTATFSFVWGDVPR